MPVADNKIGTIEMLEAAYKKRDPNLPYILRYPIFDFLKDEVGFRNLCNKLKLTLRGPDRSKLLKFKYIFFLF